MKTDLPRLDGRTILITGASSGIGAEAASLLAGAGAIIVLAVRDPGKGQRIADRLMAEGASARPIVEQVDMAELDSIRALAARLSGSLPSLDALLNNAGLMQMTRVTTADNFELVFGTNHLGHFALTGLVMPLLLRSAAPRVVTISSIAHRGGSLDFDDLQGERRYSGGKAYNQSKLANLMFALELDRRARAAGSRLISVAAHPGVARTGFMAATRLPRPIVGLANAAIGVLALDARDGALPGVVAVSQANIAGGSYLGPDGFMEARGKPAPARIAPQARDNRAAERLWRVSEELTGVVYPSLA